MPADPREEMALALAEQSPDDDDLRDWLTDRAAFVLDALASAGFHLCAEGQAVVSGQVVTLEQFGGYEVVVHHAPGFAAGWIASLGSARPWPHEPIPPEVGINGHVGTWTTVHGVYYAVEREEAPDAR